MTFGWRTLDVGEKALIYNKNGWARVEEGPQRIFLFREEFKKMKCYSASQKEYLVIKYKPGTQDHLRGPCTQYFNEVEHISITVKDLCSISANEAVVVYTQDSETKQVDTRVAFGPTLLLLAENQWLHSFSWHGTDPNNKTRMVPNQDKFTVLKIIPDQFYYNVDEVRTKDDALLRVKLMMFYELTDVSKMLNSTEDPIADFINCLDADVIAFAAMRNYEEFIETVSELNDLDNFPLLMDRCRDIGYTVTKVVFRGYFAHEKLQVMHDLMIKKRTELTLKFEREVQEQNLIDAKLESEMERLDQEQSLELDSLLHSQKLEKDALEHRLNLEKTSRLQQLEERKQENKNLLDAAKAEDQIEADHLRNLNKLNVDVTSLLVTRSGIPHKVTNVVAGEKAAQVHIHHNDLANIRLGSSISTSM